MRQAPWRGFVRQPALQRLARGQESCQRLRFGRAMSANTQLPIGIFGTTTTVRSEAYSRAILARDDSARVFARACPLLVPLVEEGWTNNKITQAILRAYLSPMLRRRIDTLVLGCTHYPLLKKVIRGVVGEEVALIDSAESCAQFLSERLGGTKLLAGTRRRAGVILPFVTDEVERFDEM